MNEVNSVWKWGCCLTNNPKIDHSSDFQNKSRKECGNEGPKIKLSEIKKINK